MFRRRTIFVANCGDFVSSKAGEYFCSSAFLMICYFAHGRNATTEYHMVLMKTEDLRMKKTRVYHK